ncbi:MAG: hypothetical protein GXO84_03620 [Chlorobi bacterium]|nr:hypothetical protein [Chlorobiota bacterium]
MRTSLIFSLIFTLLFSYDSKQKYQGTWFVSNYSGNDFPEKLEIRNDSIHFNYPDFNYQNSYSLKIINNTFKFNNVSVSAKIYTDSLILNNYNVYTKSSYKDIPLDTFENKIIIELPKLKLNNLSSFDYTNKGYVVSHVRYGIRHDNGEYSLQLNDKFSDFKDLASFLAFERSSIRYEVMPSFKTLFFIDKNAKMIEIEKLFLVLSLINNLSIDFVNNINLKH